MWTKWFMWNKRKTLKTKQEVLLVLCFWLTENVHTKEIDRNSFILQLFLHLQKTKRTKGIFQVSCLWFLWSSWSKINDGCWVTLSNNTSIHESRPTINTREQKISDSCDSRSTQLGFIPDLKCQFLWSEQIITDNKRLLYLKDADRPHKKES